MLEATDELLVDGRLGDSAWTRLHEELTPHQVTDLIFIVGTYAMLAMAFESWQLQPEPGMARLPEAPSKPSGACPTNDTPPLSSTTSSPRLAEPRPPNS